MNKPESFAVSTLLDEVFVFGADGSVACLKMGEVPVSETAYVIVTGASGGGAGGAQSFVHEQPIASDLWLILHPLGRTPTNIEVIDATGAEHESVVELFRADRVSLRFAYPVAGKATLY